MTESWSGTIRTPLQNQLVYPRPESGTLRSWVGVGDNPQSVVRVAHYGVPLMLAIIGAGDEVDGENVTSGAATG